MKTKSVWVLLLALVGCNRVVEFRIDLCKAVVCTKADQCHVAGTCDPDTGMCSNPAASDGAACDDGDSCTQTDTCASGVCTGTDPVTCTAMDQCHVAGTCDSTSGECSNPTVTDGTACNDDNACTQTDTCVSGVCTGADPVTCTAMDQCHAAGTCDPTSGECSNPSVTDGTACDDDNGCTQTDTCLSGVCTGADPVTCTAMDQCHTAGTCDPTSGECSNPSMTDGTGCNDNNSCTQTDTCMSGVCTGTDPVTCTAMDQCHTVGTCDPTSGVCSNPAAGDGSTCGCGSCHSGACQAISLGATFTSAGGGYPTGLTLDSVNLYMTNSGDGFAGQGEVTSLPKAGGTLTAVYSGDTNAGGITVAGATLYFTDSTGLLEVATTGGTPTMVDTPGPSGLASDDNNIYWTNYSSGQIVEQPLGGGALTVLASGQSSPVHIATDGVNVYWDAQGSGSIVQISVSGGSPLTLASGLQLPSGIAIDQDNVYFTDDEGGTVNMVPIGGTTVTTLATGQPQPVSVTVMNGIVYWGNNNGGENGTIMKVPVTGGSPVEILGAASEENPSRLVNDGVCIYWIDTGSGTVARAPP